MLNHRHDSSQCISHCDQRSSLRVDKWMCAALWHWFCFDFKFDLFSFICLLFFFFIHWNMMMYRFGNRNGKIGKQSQNVYAFYSYHHTIPCLKRMCFLFGKFKEMFKFLLYLIKRKCIVEFFLSLFLVDVNEKHRYLSLFAKSFTFPAPFALFTMECGSIF